MIVGHKIEQWLTAEKRDYGGHWEVTSHRRVTQLHSTKGWRPVGHSKHVQLVRHLPSPRVWREADVTTFVGGRPKRDRRPIGLTDAAMEKAAMRHKVRRVEIQRAKNLAANA